MSIRVIEASINSTLQDLGRACFAHLGIRRAGAMDSYSLILANILLGNTFDEAGLELCLRGGKYEFLDEHYFVLSGACFGAKLNGEFIQTCKVYKALKGAFLELGFALKGFRGYLCVAGGFEVEKNFHSKSSDASMQLGLFEGRNIKNEDILPTNSCFTPFNIKARTCENPVLKQDLKLKIRVLLDKEAFTLKGIETFLNTEYKIDSKSDRMALYTKSEHKIEHKFGADLISEPNVFGCVQVPQNGLPLILMADRATSGGYTKIAYVIENDLSLLAQAKLGSSLCFQSLAYNEAIRLYKQRQQELRALDKKLNLIFENALF